MCLPHSHRIARGTEEDPSRHLLDADPLQRDNRTTLKSIASITLQVKTNANDEILRFAQNDRLEVATIACHARGRVKRPQGIAHRPAEGNGV